MSSATADVLDRLETVLAGAEPLARTGRILQVTGLVIEAEGPECSVGDVCKIETDRSSVPTTAEVVGFRDHRVLLMPLAGMSEVHVGARVRAMSHNLQIPVGKGLVGRVLDGLGRPLDHVGPLLTQYVRDLHRDAPNPLLRRKIDQPFSTGIRSIDTFTSLGCGQRVGVFAGSGVGKSTLMGMIARGAESDVNVIALVGERGRELREFIENDLGPEGLAKSVLVISTSDQPAPLRLRAAFLATRIAESFRSEGKKVLFMMDSLTRLAFAQREIGLAIGEPPATRGYTPSVFSLLPRLLERTGQDESGSITALYTVLVEGDDLNEPVADTVRGILDGHIVLSRTLASANQYPPVDVLESISRLTRQVCSAEELAIVAKARDMLSLYQKNEDLISIGAYTSGTKPPLDQAIARFEPIRAFLRQDIAESTNREDAFRLLKEATG